MAVEIEAEAGRSAPEQDESGHNHQQKQEEEEEIIIRGLSDMDNGSVRDDGGTGGAAEMQNIKPKKNYIRKKEDAIMMQMSTVKRKKSGAKATNGGSGAVLRKPLHETSDEKYCRLVATVGAASASSAAAATSSLASVLTVLGGKASCRRKFVLHVQLLDEQGNVVQRNMPIVASVAYAHDHAPVAAGPTAGEPGTCGLGGGNNNAAAPEPPLFTTFNGVEFPARDNPTRMVGGRATFKLAISLLSSKFDNRLFSICFTPQTHPPVCPPCFSPPIRSISRKRTNSATNIPPALAAPPAPPPPFHHHHHSQNHHHPDIHNMISVSCHPGHPAFFHGHQLNTCSRLSDHCSGQYPPHDEYHELPCPSPSRHRPAACRSGSRQDVESDSSSEDDFHKQNRDYDGDHSRSDEHDACSDVKPDYRYNQYNTNYHYGNKHSASSSGAAPVPRMGSIDQEALRLGQQRQDVDYHPHLPPLASQCNINPMQLQPQQTTSTMVRMAAMLSPRSCSANTTTSMDCRNIASSSTSCTNHSRQLHHHAAALLLNSRTSLTPSPVESESPTLTSESCCINDSTQQYQLQHTSSNIKRLDFQTDLHHHQRPLSAPSAPISATRPLVRPQATIGGCKFPFSASSTATGTTAITSSLNNQRLHAAQSLREHDHHHQDFVGSSFINTPATTVTPNSSINTSLPGLALSISHNNSPVLRRQTLVDSLLQSLMILSSGNSTPVHHAVNQSADCNVEATSGVSVAAAAAGVLAPGPGAAFAANHEMRRPAPCLMDNNSLEEEEKAIQCLEASLHEVSKEIERRKEEIQKLKRRRLVMEDEARLHNILFQSSSWMHSLNRQLS